MYNKLVPEETYKPELKETAIPPIDPESIESVRISLKRAFGIDLEAEGVTISINYPGDETFDAVESNYREEVGVASNLTGELPGFVAVISENHIAFFAIKPEKTVEMANRYAEKEDMDIRFTNTDDAAEFIAELSIKALVHEITHIAWPDKIDPEFMQKWQAYIMQNEPLRQRVIELQRDKYGDVERIPVAEEALADAMVEVLTFGRLQSRLGMPDVSIALRGLIHEKDIDAGLVNRYSVSREPLDPTNVQLNEYGEIV